MHLNIIHSVDATLWWRWIQCFFYVLIYYFFSYLCAEVSVRRSRPYHEIPVTHESVVVWCTTPICNQKLDTLITFSHRRFEHNVRGELNTKKKKTMLFIVCGPWVRGDPVVSRSVPTIVFHKHSKNRLDVLLHHRWRTIVNHSVGGHWQCCISPKLPFDGTTNHHHSSNYIYHLCVSGPWKGAIHSHTTPAHKWIDTS